MKAQELRLRNLVLIDGEELPIDIDDLQCIIDGQINRYQPITLTEEWLLKFGFKKYKNPNNTDSEIFRKDHIKILFSEYGYELRDFNEFHVYIQSVHQLQNLYFALTGEDLILK